jgi:hypothetical protein
VSGSWDVTVGMEVMDLLLKKINQYINVKMEKSIFLTLSLLNLITLVFGSFRCLQWGDDSSIARFSLDADTW